MADTGLTHGVWLERVPELVQECVEGWELGLGEPYVAGAAGYTARAELRDGTPAVLRERTRWWTIGQTLAWTFDSAYLPQHVQTVRWLVEAAP